MLNGAREVEEVERDFVKLSMKRAAGKLSVLCILFNKTKQDKSYILTIDSHLLYGQQSSLSQREETVITNQTI